jgi:anthranilate/para-aminobenzoate synthase component II
MKSYLNQTTVNVVAIATAVVTGLSLVGVGQGPDKAMKEQMLMNRRLDYDIARLRNCGELKKYGVEYHPESTMSFLCADVIVNPTE